LFSFPARELTSALHHLGLKGPPVEALSRDGLVPDWGRVIVYVSFMNVLHAEFIVRGVEVGDRRVVMLVIVGCRQMFPLVALAGFAVMGDVRMPVRMPDRLMVMRWEIVPLPLERFVV